MNPVYTLETDSRFVYNGYAAEIIENDGFNLEIKDWNPVGRNDKLGTVHITADEIWSLAASTSSSTEKDFKISPPKELKGETPRKAGFVTVRIHHATLKDRIQFNKKEDDTVYWVPEIALSERSLDLLSNDSIPNKKDRVSLLIGIESCRELLSADPNGLSDPYVKVGLGGKDIHKTQHILKT